MKNRNFEYVYTVYQEGSFSKAAQKLYISQPALSAAIKKIETDLYGVPLFNRGVNPVTLTPAGEFYLSAAREIAETEDRIEAYFASAAGVRGGTLNLGSSAYFCTYVLPGIIKRYSVHNPDSTINLIETVTTSMEDKLKSGELHLILDVESMDRQSFESIPLGREYILLAVPAHFAVNERLAAYRLTSSQIRDLSFLADEIPAVNLSLLREEPFLLLKKQHDMYRRAMELCRHAGFEPKAGLYLDQMLTAYNIAKNGQGVTFFRNTLLHFVEESDRLAYYKIGDEMAFREIWLTFKKTPAPTPLTEDFIKFVLLQRDASGPVYPKLL